jgi:hypothetical protein
MKKKEYRASETTMNINDGREKLQFGAISSFRPQQIPESIVMSFKAQIFRISLSQLY